MLAAIPVDLFYFLEYLFRVAVRSAGDLVALNYRYT